MSELEKIAKHAIDKAKQDEGLKEAELSLGEAMDEKEGARAAKQFYDKNQEINEEAQHNIMDYLKKNQNDKAQYKRTLGEVLYARLCQVGWPPGYRWRVLVKDKGVAVAFTDYTGKLYSKGIKECGIVIYDFAAIDQLGNETENTVNRLTGEDGFNTADSGGGGDFTPIGG